MTSRVRFQSYESVQVLRFIAAMMVVFTHATFYVNTRINSDVSVWNEGAQGVSLFFVISGLVMSLSGERLVGDPARFRLFVMARLIRIVPLYWAVNLVKLIGISFVPVAVFASPDFLNVVASFLFVFSRNSEGAIETFHGVGWTLNFEMFFYVLFAFSLLISSRKKSLLFLIAALASCVSLSYIREDSWPAATFLFHPIIINFIWGLLLAEWIKSAGGISRWVSIAMFLGGFFIIFVPPTFETFGLQYAAVVAGAVFLERDIRGRVPKPLIFAGDASYSLYLVHPLVGVAVAVTLSVLGFDSGLTALLIIATVSYFVASATYVYFERPMTRFLKSKYGGSSTKHGLVANQ